MRIRGCASPLRGLAARRGRLLLCCVLQIISRCLCRCSLDYQPRSCKLIIVSKTRSGKGAACHPWSSMAPAAGDNMMIRCCPADDRSRTAPYHAAYTVRTHVLSVQSLFSKAAHHLVAEYLTPLSTGQPPCSAPESRRPSVRRLQNATAEPALGFTASPRMPHSEYCAALWCTGGGTLGKTWARSQQRVCTVTAHDGRQMQFARPRMPHSKKCAAIWWPSTGTLGNAWAQVKKEVSDGALYTTAARTGPACRTPTTVQPSGGPAPAHLETPGQRTRRRVCGGA